MAGGGIQVRKYPRDREHEKFIYNLLTHHRVLGAAAVADGAVGSEARRKCTAPLRHRFILDGPLLLFFSPVCLAQMLVSGNKRRADTGSASFGRGGGGGGRGNKPLSSGLKKSFPLTSSLTPLSPLSPAAAAPLPNPVAATSRPHLCMKCAYIESAHKKRGEMGAEEVTQAISQNRGPRCDI